MRKFRATESLFHPFLTHSSQKSLLYPSVNPFGPFTKCIQSKGFNYGFIEYDDPASAERAMATLNGRRVHQAVGSTHRLAAA